VQSEGVVQAVLTAARVEPRAERLGPLLPLGLQLGTIVAAMALLAWSLVLGRTVRLDPGGRAFPVQRRAPPRSFVT
jgi:hypothetical protein